MAEGVQSRTVAGPGPNRVVYTFGFFVSVNEIDWKVIIFSGDVEIFALVSR